MTITIVEFNVLKVMAEKDIDWSWMVLDRTLAIRNIPGFGNVANIVTKLVNHGLVDIVMVRATLNHATEFLNMD